MCRRDAGIKRQFTRPLYVRKPATESLCIFCFAGDYGRQSVIVHVILHEPHVSAMERLKQKKNVILSRLFTHLSLDISQARKKKERFM